MKKLCIGILAFLSFSPLFAQQTEKSIVVRSSSGVEAAADLPEGMLSETDSLYLDWISKNYINLGENCTATSTNPEVSDSIYMDRLQRIPAIIEMPYNEVVRKFIDMYATRLRQKIAFMLSANNFYMPIFEEALDLHDLPLELKYLPVIESALNPMATSRQGAVGLWQFMLATGKIYGLQVTSLIDERRDPIKSTRAAARYLSRLESGTCGLQLRSGHNKQSYPTFGRRKGLLEAIQLSASGNSWICAGIYRCKLYHDLLL